jgi:hypothetical protein
MEPIFVDQCQDVAVLAIHDSDFCEDHHLLELEAIPLFWGPIVGDQVGSLWTPDRGAIPVKFRMPGGPQLLLDTGSNVSNGTSGGPILDNTGAAVAVFSMDQGIAGADSYLLSKGPCLSQCLPPWVAKLLRS